MHAGHSLRALLEHPDILVLPGVQDALSARLAQAHGFTAVVAGGNAATGTLLGAADLGQLGLHDFADHYGRIAAATGLPVVVDADTGFGGPHNVTRMVRAFEQAGVAGFFMEDQVTPKRCGYLSGKAVVPVREQLGKLAAALDARRDPALVICARTDALGVEGMNAALDRAALYREAGADMVFVQGADEAQTLRAVCAAVPGPHLANVSQASGRAGLSAAECQEAGAAAVMFPMAALLAALRAMDRLFASLRRTGRVEPGDDALLPLAQYNALAGLEGLMAAEDAYAARADTILSRHMAKAG
jgi:methylisocitrate lyase